MSRTNTSNRLPSSPNWAERSCLPLPPPFLSLAAVLAWSWDQLSVFALAHGLWPRMAGGPGAGVLLGTALGANGLSTSSMSATALLVSGLTLVHLSSFAAHRRLSPIVNGNRTSTP